MSSPATTFHVRRPLLRARGNSFYRDKSDRGQGTYCGAPEALYDVTARDRARAWTRPEDGRRFEPCAACVAARAAELRSSS